MKEEDTGCYEMVAEYIEKKTSIVQQCMLTEVIDRVPHRGIQ